MTNLAIHSEPRILAKPEPRSPISIRVATAEGADLHFIDELMKEHSHMVGFAPTSELEDHIKNGTALIAEDAETGARIGYCLYKDRYNKREDCGNVSQLNVLPGKQRGLVGAALVKAMFERLPYGVRLFCCWCAQDLEANHFWEALGFVPLAFRTGARSRAQGGSRKETRMHIFWERRVREGDEYPFWFPSQTNHGRLGEARIVLPIQPGTHWSDAKPTVLPGMEKLGGDAAPPALPEGEANRGTPKPKREKPPKAKAPPVNPISESGGLWFAPPPPAKPTKAEAAATKPKRERRKNDPKLVAAAREFRDRYLDEVNSGRVLLGAEGASKYDVSRQLAAAERIAPSESLPHLNLLNAA